MIQYYMYPLYVKWLKLFQCFYYSNLQYYLINHAKYMLVILLWNSRFDIISNIWLELLNKKNIKYLKWIKQFMFWDQ